MSEQPPTRARVVIIGGGVIGASVAYHLTRLGWTDVVLLEQGRLSCGTTWHAAGLVGQLRASESGTRLVQYSARLYAELEAETGLATGYKQSGGLTVARTPERWVHLQRTQASAAAYGIECDLLTADAARERYPLLHVEDLLGAIWLPGDGKVNPTDVTASLARGARQRGARIIERARVTDVLTEPAPLGSRGVPRVIGVRVDVGGAETQLEAEVVVNCAGQWAMAVGALAGVTVPLHSAEHFYVVTEPIDGVHPDLPVLRDPDGWTYIKEEVGGLVVGGFEPEAKPWVSPDALPHPFEFALLEEDWEHFSVLMDSAVHRLPVLAETGIRKFYNGPESFTPDNQFVLGRAPEVDGFFVGAGFNSVGIASAGGAGRALAEWIVEGEPTSDLAAVDIRRFAGFHGNVPWLRARVSEVLGLHYAVPWPNREFQTGRPFRRSAVHDQIEAAGAVFGSRMGWERPLYFAPSSATEPAPTEPTYAWGRPDWLCASAAEQVSTRTGVTVFDESSFSKYRIEGRDAEAALQWVCTADVAVPVGSVVYTGMLGPRGTYEADVTLTRLAADDYLMVSSAASTVRDLDHLRRHLPAGLEVSVSDVTTVLAVLAVMGPRSRDLLATLTRADLDDAAFPFATSREVDLGFAPVRLSRITYAGELGFEVYAPVELAAGVLDEVLRAGEEFGVRLGGYYAIESLRLEKGYRAFGRELTPDCTPVEAGLLFTCKLGTEVPFLGRGAVEAARASGPPRRIVSLVLDDPEPMLWGGELVLRHGMPVGQVTSAAWGATVRACVGLARIGPGDGEIATPGWARSGTYSVDVGGVRHSVRVSTTPPYDPSNGRVLG